MKKPILITAFILYTLGILVIVDWMVFCDKNSTKFDDFGSLKTKYVQRFPEGMQSFFSLNPQPAALFFSFGFIAAGFIFLKQKHKNYTILAVSSFILGMWNLFSIM